MKNRDKKISIILNLTIVALVLFSLTLLDGLFGPQIDTLVRAIESIVFPLVVALFISYLLAPFVKILEKRFKVPARWMSIVIVFLGVMVIGIGFTYVVGELIYSQAVIFINNDWDNIVVSVTTLIEDNQSVNELYVYLGDYLSIVALSPYIINVFSLFRSLTTIIITIVLVPVFLFFILNDKQKIFEGMLVVVPKKYLVHAKELGKRGNDVVEKYFNGRFLSMFIMSIMFTTIFLILGFGQRSFFFGFTLGFLDIIPYIGGFVGMLLPLLYSLTISDGMLFAEWTWLAVLIANTIGQVFQQNILQPIIMGKEVKLHPLLVLSSFVFFGSLMGITGVILAIPITGMIKATFEYFQELKED